MSAANLPALCSWSGGKDSCLALHLALESGIPVTRLLTVFEPDADRSRSHALPLELLADQAAALGLELRAPRADWATYERVFVEELEHAREAGIGQAIFGDIDLLPHREWEEKVCRRAGLAAHLPLWNWARERVVAEILARGMKAICVCINTRFLPESFAAGPTMRRSFAICRAEWTPAVRTASSTLSSRTPRGSPDRSTLG